MIKKMLIIISVLTFLLGCTSGPEVVVEERAQPSSPPVLGEEDSDDGPSVLPLPTGAAVEVHVLGKQGFDPSEFTASVGQEVIFVNDDAKTFSMTFVKDGSRKFENSDLTKPGASYTHVFKEPGVYQFWTIGYGVRGTATIQ